MVALPSRPEATELCASFQYGKVTDSSGSYEGLMIKVSQGGAGVVVVPRETIPSLIEFLQDCMNNPIHHNTPEVF